MGIGMTEWLVIIVAVLLLFGARRIPELARALGRASYEFKKAKSEIVKESGELAKAAEDNAARHDHAAADAAATAPRDDDPGKPRV